MNIVAEKNMTEVYVSLTDRQKDRQTHNGKTLYPLFHRSGGIITFSKKYIYSTFTWKCDTGLKLSYHWFTSCMMSDL